MGVIYLDSCVVIYAVEDVDVLGRRVRERLESVPETTLAISTLVVHECLVGPLRSGDPELRDRYEQAFARFEIVDLGLAHFVRAAELRAATSLRTPDALHLAAAQIAGCDELWTNDRRLASASRGLAHDIIGVG